jgi:SAM-dependent methyltransferase
VAKAEEYADLRRDELRRALGVVGVGFERIHLLNFTDGEASQSIAPIAHRLIGLLDSVNPDIILTHAYEGGHPDHDATAIAVHAAMAMTSRGHPHEMALYHGSAQEDVAVHAFLPGTSPVYTAPLDNRLRDLKSAMLSCYRSQQQYEQYFAVDVERYRCAPAYDFGRSPDPGRTLLYERSGGGAAERFRALASGALQELGLSQRVEAASGRSMVGATDPGAESAAPDSGTGREAPLVSVIVRTIGRTTLGHALASIANQTYNNVEVVLVNASTEEISAIGDPGRLRLRPCGGLALDRPQAANVGLKAATGDYVMFLDDDDWFHPEHVESLVAGLRRAGDARVAYAGVEVLEWLDDSPPHRRWAFDSPFDPIALLCENYIPLNAVLIDRHLLDEVGGFDEQLPLYEDWDFLIGLSRRSRFQKIPRISAAYRWPPGSGVTDPTVTAAAQARVYTKWRGTLRSEEYVALIQRAVAETELKTGRDSQLQKLLSHLSAQDDELERLRPCVRDQELQLQEFRSHFTAMNGELERLRLSPQGPPAAAAPGSVEAGSLTFRCNICGQHCVALMSQIDREVPSCSRCGSTARFRAIVHVLSVEVFGKSLVLPDFPERRDLKGIGMSDWDGYARLLSVKFDYQNTHYHIEPRLDIVAIDPSLEGRFDFVVASEVFEHVPPPVGRAFENAFRLLKPGGLLVFSVPYGPTGSTIEHYPDLHDYQLIATDHGCALRNTTVRGETQLFTNLVFHGGDGATLEMRVFSEPSLIEEFRRAGFPDPVIHREPYFAHGVYSRLPWSYLMSVRKPLAK